MLRSRRLNRRASLAALVLGSAAALAACGGDGAGASDDLSTASGSVASTGSVAPTGVVVPVIALDNTFRPQNLEVHVGDTVSWENRGINEHNVLSIEGSDWGVEVADFQPGDVYTHVFTEPGEYAYYCSIHGTEQAGMVGTLTVTP
jgi:plastocyanin